jgi:hypothetical protein
MFGVLWALMYYTATHTTKEYVKRAKADMRYVALALDRYHNDHKRYPEAVANPSADVVQNAPSILAPHTLTTPTRYLSDGKKLPLDRMSPGRKMNYGYHAAHGGYILSSAGPDRTYNLVQARDYEGLTTTAIRTLAHVTYDPTNGTIVPVMCGASTG